MAKKDYYKILGVEKNASEDDVKKAYRKLAHQYHPDKASGDEAKFKEVNEAYQVLSDKQKRTAYDQFGTADFSGFPGGANVNWSDFANMGGFPGGVDIGDLGDIFETFFGGGMGRRTRTVTHGADLELLQEITLEEAFRGVVKPITIGTWVRCATCKGQGGDPASGMETCPVCAGKGDIREERRTFFGTFSQVKACDRCSGKGEVPKKVCAVCKGKGRTTGERTTTLEIIPGIQDGQLIQIKGFGEAGERGAQAGDLYVRIKVKPHAVFTRRGDDLIVRHEIKAKDLLLGKPVAVPTLDGAKTEFEIPPNFDLKQPYRIPGKGMPRMGSYGKGDLLVDFIIKAPKKPGAKDRKLLEELE
jgi:molecular chaperone DnaJ